MQLPNVEGEALTKEEAEEVDAHLAEEGGEGECEGKKSNGFGTHGCRSHLWSTPH